MCRRQTKRKLESMRSIDTPKIYPDTLHDKHGKETADPVYRSIEVAIRHTCLLFPCKTLPAQLSWLERSN